MLHLLSISGRTLYRATACGGVASSGGEEASGSRGVGGIFSGVRHPLCDSVNGDTGRPTLKANWALWRAGDRHLSVHISLFNVVVARAYRASGGLTGNGRL